MSSTTIPIVIATTTDSEVPTSPTASPQIPNPMMAGAKLGTRLTRPSLKERKAISRRAEMPASTIAVPISIARMLRCPMCANISAMPEPSVRAMCVALLLSHASARSFSASTSAEESVFAVTVMRVADLSTAMRLLRSRPKGSESS